MGRLFVLSLGGSLIFPNKLDSKFLKNFKSLISRQIGHGHRFIIITGGGMVCREYQDVLRRLSKPSADELDWMGIAATKLNAELVKLMFGKLSHPKVIDNPGKKVNFTEKILVGAGFVPGHSSDFDAVVLAKTYGANAVINLSNIDYVYTKDPRKYKSAQRIEHASWKEYLEIVGTKWTPGRNFPFDPIAAQFARRNKQEVIIVNGKNLKNLEKAFKGQHFKGTTIR